MHHDWRQEQRHQRQRALRQGSGGVLVLQLLSQLRRVCVRGESRGRDTGEEQVRGGLFGHALRRSGGLGNLIITALCTRAEHLTRTLRIHPARNSCPAWPRPCPSTRHHRTTRACLNRV